MRRAAVVSTRDNHSGCGVHPNDRKHPDGNSHWTRPRAPVSEEEGGRHGG